LNNCIFTAVDKKYEEYAKACFNSLIKNYKNHPEVLIYYEELTDEFKSYVNTLENFKLIKKKLFNTSQLNLGPVSNKIVYFRYLLWSNEFHMYDNVMHLDVDTLILGDLSYLFETQEFLMFDNMEILKDVYIIQKSIEAQTALSEYGIQYDVYNPPKFANAGIFVIPKKYRTKENLNQLLNISKDLSIYLKYADQSAINLWMIKNNIPVSDKIEYNFQPHFFNYQDNMYELKDVKIIHFAAKKVDTIQFILWWRTKNLSSDFYKLYKEYLVGS